MSTSSDKYFLRPSCNVFIFLFCAIILFATPFPVKAYGSPDQIKKQSQTYLLSETVHSALKEPRKLPIISRMNSKRSATSR